MTQTAPESEQTSELAFLAGEGEMATLMRAKDWTTTPLGPPQAWPQSLRTCVRLMLNTRHPVFLFWGPDAICLYNDGYRQLLGRERHAIALGNRGAMVWEEIWHIIGPQVAQVMAGNGATWHENDLIPLTRDGRRENTWWTYSYSPIDEDSAPNRVGGVLVLVSETTQTVLAERKRSAEMARLRSMFEQAPSFVCIMQGPSHVFEFVNNAHRQLFNSHDWVGKPLREAFPDIAGQGFYEAMDHVYTSGERLIFKATPVRFHAGPQAVESVRILDFIYEPMRDDTGTISGIFCEGFDVTEAHKAEEALRRSEEQLRLATEAAGIGLWDVDLTSGQLYWQPRVKAMFGLSADVPAIIDHYIEGLHPEDRDETRAKFAAATDPALRATYDAEYRTVGIDDGVIRWISSRGRGIFNDEGVCVRVVGTAADITARKQAEEKLRELNETLEKRVNAAVAERKLLADIVESTDAMIQIIDLDFNWLSVNKASADAFERIFGVRPAAGDNMLNALAGHPKQQAAVRQIWGRALSGAPFTAVEPIGEDSSDPRYYEMKFNPLRDKEGQVIGAYQFVYDVTERLHDQARLAEAEEQLRQSQKIEAIGQLTGGIAHDFNNLLMVITGGLSILERQPDTDKRQRIQAGMRQAAERGASLTRQLLAFSRRQALRPEPVDLVHQVGSMRELLDRTLGANIQIETLFPSDLWPVTADPSELELVVLNLCVNARDAMPNGGCITISAENVHLAHDGQEGDFVKFGVEDTGFGMTKDVLARVFEPFFTTKDVGKGTGLGLPQVYGFAHQSGGAVEIESVVDQGTIVTLYLPRADAAPAETGVSVNLDTAFNGPRGKVLLVEDDEEVSTLVAEMLAQLGFDVTRAASAQGALGALANGRTVDIVFSDIMMPGGMNGIELAREIHHRRPGLPVLLTTGYPEVARHDAANEGVELLPKPYDLKALQAALNRAMTAAATQAT
ncbi:hypothetical protein AEAC466_00595 [Asticcacaulis sp. AC466]|uniref:PAS domain-containing protein n=1 Tax=Asticcacaulis sp. AC466 TaxID=1282362 RepID=UPI0003C3F2E3|nr:PAS domain-containing protein [Asticcacaulis sp. AC466]ESQ85702.1 hypothetical protein AEAC466_00595 [Asticcacaulis sp. AC466]